MIVVLLQNNNNQMEFGAKMASGLRVVNGTKHETIFYGIDRSSC
jgi:hypothetical protein